MNEKNMLKMTIAFERLQNIGQGHIKRSCLGNQVKKRHKGTEAKILYKKDENSYTIKIHKHITAEYQVHGVCIVKEGGIGILRQIEIEIRGK